MAERVVDALEPVEVEQEDRSLVTGARLEEAPHVALEGTAIGQIGEGIVIGEMSDLAPALPELIDGLGGAIHVFDAVLQHDRVHRLGDEVRRACVVAELQRLDVVEVGHDDD